MDQILARLWLGSFDDAAAYAEPSTQAIAVDAVLTLCETRPEVALALQHVHAPIPDEVYLPRETWAELIHSLTTLLTRRHVVLVHCRLGVSRAPALVAAYLAHVGHSSDPQTALTYLVTRRGCVSPHQETWRGVTEWFWGRMS